MDPFTIIVAGGMAAIIIAILLLGLFHPRSGADVLRWTPTRSPEVEVQNEIDDVAQMIEAQNALRRRRGAPERTEEEVEESVRQHKRELDEYARDFWASQSRLERGEPDGDA